MPATSSERVLINIFKRSIASVFLVKHAYISFPNVCFGWRLIANWITTVVKKNLANPCWPVGSVVVQLTLSSRGLLRWFDHYMGPVFIWALTPTIVSLCVLFCLIKRQWMRTVNSLMLASTALDVCDVSSASVTWVLMQSKTLLCFTGVGKSSLLLRFADNTFSGKLLTF